MNTGKHTPGPWRYSYTSAAKAREQSDDGTDGGGADGSILAGPRGLRSQIIAFLPHHRDPKEDAEREANAALIASAPDLLEALEDLMAIRAKCFIPNNGDWWDRKALAAIAKAKGGGK